MVEGSRTRSRKPRAEPAHAKRSRALITVDVGNSDTVIGLFRGSSLEGFWRVTSSRRTAHEVGLLLRALLRERDEALDGAPGTYGRTTAPARLPKGAVLCSVVPTLAPAWGEALEHLVGEPPFEVSAASVGQLAIRYRDRGAVGADRIANAIAVRAIYGTPAIVVDLGTATTFDCISRSGAYLGGVIAPGVGTSAEELFRRAARLPRVGLRKPPRAIGRSTEESLQAGIVWGAAGQVDALVRRVALEMKGTPHVIATGGYASIIAPECETINRVDEALTLKGMRILWDQSR